MYRCEDDDRQEQLATLRFMDAAAAVTGSRHLEPMPRRADSDAGVALFQQQQQQPYRGCPDKLRRQQELCL